MAPFWRFKNSCLLQRSGIFQVQVFSELSYPDIVLTHLIVHVGTQVIGTRHQSTKFALALPLLLTYTSPYIQTHLLPLVTFHLPLLGELRYFCRSYLCHIYHYVDNRRRSELKYNMA